MNRTVCAARGRDTGAAAATRERRLRKRTALTMIILVLLVARLVAAGETSPASPRPAAKSPAGVPVSGLLGNRFLTFTTVVRVRQVETTRTEASGPDESSVHTPKEARARREMIDHASIFSRPPRARRISRISSTV
jgi:hypothetical protein